MVARTTALLVAPFSATAVLAGRSRRVTPGCGRGCRQWPLVRTSAGSAGRLVATRTSTAAHPLASIVPEPAIPGDAGGRAAGMARRPDVYAAIQRRWALRSV